MIGAATRPVLWLSGWICLGLALLGAFLPVLPTTPFLILAAWLFSKSSPRLHQWLLRMPAFGPAIQDWEANRVIRPRAKWMATIVILAVFGFSIGFTSLHWGLKCMLFGIAALVLVFIWTRKSRETAS
ncbi:MAG: YbaN family protein [Leptospiraceae bacterium]|nr:YbaN family protein [Leptospiraceae bacterium]